MTVPALGRTPRAVDRIRTDSGSGSHARAKARVKRKIADDQYIKMVRHIERRLKKLNPDELGDDDFRGVRAWWD